MEIDEKNGYSIWKSAYEDGFCVCTTLQGYEDAYRLKRGEPAGTNFPKDAYFPMDPEFPDDVKLGDNIKNAGGFVLVSRRLKELVESDVAESVEYLPVRIMNHKSRLASSDYFLINPLDVYDAIDLTKSIVKRNNINPEAIATISRLILDDRDIPAVATVFRLKGFERRVVVRNNLAKKVASAGFIGIQFTDTAAFRGF